MKDIVDTKSGAKTVCTTFTPPPRIVEKESELQAMIFDEESASDAQKFLAPPKRRILEKKWRQKFRKKHCQTFLVSTNEMSGIV